LCKRNSGYCQQSLDKRFTYCVGLSATASFVGQDGGAGVTIFYVSPPGEEDNSVRKGTVTIKCNPAATKPLKIDIHNPTNVNDYSIEFESAAACPKTGLSGGSIFLIIVIPGLAIYFFGGMLYLGVIKGYRGKELIPNLEFWLTIPGLVQDGVTFTISKIKEKLGKN
jgi:hypothetical protein